MLQCSFQSGGWVTLTPVNVCQDFCQVCLVLCLPTCLPATVNYVRSRQVDHCRFLNLLRALRGKSSCSAVIDVRCGISSARIDYRTAQLRFFFGNMTALHSTVKRGYNGLKRTSKLSNSYMFSCTTGACRYGML